MRSLIGYSAALLGLLFMTGTATLHAQAYEPIVHFTVTLPDNTTKDLQTHESGLATVTVAGREYGLRPTMLDDQGTRIIFTIFDMGDAKQAVRELGEVDVRGGGAVVASKTQPVFKIKATTITHGTMGAESAHKPTR